MKFKNAKVGMMVQAKVDNPCTLVNKVYTGDVGIITTVDKNAPDKADYGISVNWNVDCEGRNELWTFHNKVRIYEGA